VEYRKLAQEMLGTSGSTTIPSGGKRRKGIQKDLTALFDGLAILDAHATEAEAQPRRDAEPQTEPDTPMSPDEELLLTT